MREKIKVVDVEFDATKKPTKDTTRDRPAFVLPVVYVLEDGSRIEGQQRSSKQKDAIPSAQDLQKAAQAGQVKATVSGNAILMVERCFSLY